MKNSILFLSGIILLSLCACQSKANNAEWMQKYQGCKQIEALTAGDSFIKIDCEKGRAACEADAKGAGCVEFLSKVTIGGK